MGTNVSEIIVEIYQFSWKKIIWNCPLVNGVHSVLASMTPLLFILLTKDKLFIKTLEQIKIRYRHIIHDIDPWTPIFRLVALIVRGFEITMSYIVERAISYCYKTWNCKIYHNDISVLWLWLRKQNKVNYTWWRCSHFQPLWPCRRDILGHSF